MEKRGHEELGIKIFEIKRRIREAFEIFDHDSNQTVDVREIGTIMRSLGCYPSEADLHEIFTDLEDEESPGSIKYDKFEKSMAQILIEKRYRHSNHATLMKAFQTLDNELKGVITVEKFKTLMMEEGEPFTQEEMDEMLSTIVNPETLLIHYKDFIPFLLMDEDQ